MVLENSAVATGLEKVSFHSIPKERQRKAKECSNYRTIALVSHASKVSSRFSKLGFNSTWTENVHMFKLDLEKAKEPGIKLPTFVRSKTKQENFRKASTSASWTMLKSLLWITINCGKFLKRWEYRTTLPVSWEIYMQVKKPQLELDMKQQTGSKLGKEYIKAVYCHPAYLTSMQSTSWHPVPSLHDK